MFQLQNDGEKDSRAYLVDLQPLRDVEDLEVGDHPLGNAHNFLQLIQY